MNMAAPRFCVFVRSSCPNRDRAKSGSGFTQPESISSTFTTGVVFFRHLSHLHLVQKALASLKPWEKESKRSSPETVSLIHYSRDRMRKRVSFRLSFWFPCLKNCHSSRALPLRFRG